ncbi:4-galactosyl-N-acetylglucosaminide 3-alpha-L-fucosyltransferase 9-like [Diretmus argenteus]
MSSSVFQWTRLRLFVFGSLIMLCSVGLFFMYYKPDISFPSFGTGTISGEVQDNSTYPTEKYNHTQDPGPKIQDADAVEVHDTMILIWMWPFGYKFELSCSVFNIKGCHLTDNKTLYSKAQGVFFHHRDIHRNLANMPKEPRPWFQKWIWSNMESPSNTPPIPELNHLFNLTCNYRLDSNIPVPYGYLVPLTYEDKRFKLPAKDKLVCWIVSNWRANDKRVHFYAELKKHIKIEAYGRAFNRHVKDEDYSKTVSSCKFYLAFENSVYKDYITEKLYNPMMMGTVPVVLGPPRLNYEDHISGDSFIHVDDFVSPKELAERMLYLDQNHAEYMSYFQWRERFEVKRTTFGHELACKSCQYIQNHRGYQAFNGLNKWYWG